MRYDCTGTHNPANAREEQSRQKITMRLIVNDNARGGELLRLHLQEREGRRPGASRNAGPGPKGSGIAFHFEGQEFYVWWARYPLTNAVHR